MIFKENICYLKMKRISTSIHTHIHFLRNWFSFDTWRWFYWCYLVRTTSLLRFLFMYVFLETSRTRISTKFWFFLFLVLTLESFLMTLFLRLANDYKQLNNNNYSINKRTKKKSPKFFIQRSAVPTGAISHLSRENHAQFQKEKNREKETTQKKTALYARGNGILLCPAVWPGVCAACRGR